MVVQQQVDAERVTIEDKLAKRQAILDGLNGRIKKILGERARAAALASGVSDAPPLAEIGTIHGTAAQVGVVRDALRFLGVPVRLGRRQPERLRLLGPRALRLRPVRRQLPALRRLPGGDGHAGAESQLEPADLVFFGNPIHHVVIYAGNGLVVRGAAHRRRRQGGAPVRLRGADRLPALPAAPALRRGRPANHRKLLPGFLNCAPRGRLSP